MDIIKISLALGALCPISAIALTPGSQGRFVVGATVVSPCSILSARDVGAAEINCAASMQARARVVPNAGPIKVHTGNGVTVNSGPEKSAFYRRTEIVF